MTALDKQARELAERLVGKPQFYVTQEKAFCPGISGEWPEVIHPAHPKNARLKKVETESLIKELAAFATQVREQSKWVKVSEQLPPVGKLVWVSCDEVVQEMAARLEGKGFACEDGYEWSWADDSADNAPLEVITHWQPLPARFPR